MSDVLVLEANADVYRKYFDSVKLDKVNFHYSDVPNTQRTCDYLLARPGYAVTYLGACSDKRPRWIQSTWAGIETLVLPLQKHPEIQLTGLKDIFGPLIAEYTFNYLLEFVRRSAFYKVHQKDHLWIDNAKTPDTLQGKTICIIGTGSIGKHVAKVAKVFGLTVLGVTRSAKTALENFDELHQDINKVVSSADFVLSCLPDTISTRNILNKDTFRAMKSSGVLINVGRGASLNLPELLEALRSKEIDTAVLDVFPEEPISKDCSLWDEDRLIITPHIAASSTPHDVAQTFLKSLSLIENNQDPQYLIDINRGY